MKLTDEETKILNDFNSNKYKSVAKKSDMEKYRVAAAKTLEPSRRVYVRLMAKDVYDLQLKAVNEGISYQRLISSIVHKYNNGLLYDIKPKASKVIVK